MINSNLGGIRQDKRENYNQSQEKHCPTCTCCQSNDFLQWKKQDNARAPKRFQPIKEFKDKRLLKAVFFR